MFDLGTDLSLNDIGRALVESDVAFSVMGASGELGLSTRWRGISESLTEIQLLKASSDLGGVRGLAWLARREPRLAWKVVAAAFRARRQGSDPDDDGVTEEDTPDYLSAMLRDTVTELDEQLLDHSILSGIAVTAAQQDVRPDYLLGEPWLFVDFPDIYATEGADEERTFAVSALIHRSGVTVLTIYELIVEEEQLQHVSDRMWLQLPRFRHTAIDLAVVAHAAERVQREIAPHEVEADGSRPMAAFDHSSLTSLADLATLHADAMRQVVAALGENAACAGEWFGFPYCALRGVRPDKARVDIGARLAMGLPPGLDPYGVLVDDDVHQDRWFPQSRSLHLGAGSAVTSLSEDGQQQYAERGDDEGAAHAFAEIVIGLAIDAALIRIGLLRAVEARIRALAPVMADIHALRRYLQQNAAELSGERIFSASESAAIDSDLADSHDFARRVTGLEARLELVDAVRRDQDEVRSRISSDRLQVILLIVTVSLGVATPISAIAGWTYAERNARLPEFLADLYGRWAYVGLALIPLSVALVLILMVVREVSLRRSLRQGAVPLEQRGPTAMTEGPYMWPHVIADFEGGSEDDAAAGGAHSTEEGE